MILHCYYCAFAGDRPSEASRVAVIEHLHKPLKANMFQPLDPAHDPTPPFQSDEWRYMYHRACGRYPWPYDVDSKDGPSRVLTDEGFVEIPRYDVPDLEVQDRMLPMPDVVTFDVKKAKLITEFKQPLPLGVPAGRMLTPEESRVIYKRQPDVVEYLCDVCGKACKSPLGLNSHKRSHR